MGGGINPNNYLNYPLNAAQCQDKKSSEGDINLIVHSPIR
jgi:hypothetical protein